MDVQRTGFDGLLVLDKAAWMTSRDVVNRALGWFPRGTRIGHTGTLDPLATGVLVLCIGIATRLTEYVQQMPKVYSASIKFGAASDTDDAEGTITPLPGGQSADSRRGGAGRLRALFVGRDRAGASRLLGRQGHGPARLRSGAPGQRSFLVAARRHDRRHRHRELFVPRPGDRSPLWQGDLHPFAGARSWRAPPAVAATSRPCARLQRSAASA